MGSVPHTRDSAVNKATKKFLPSWNLALNGYYYYVKIFDSFKCYRDNTFHILHTDSYTHTNLGILMENKYLVEDSTENCSDN